jgi:heme/copper-type cytochrome/quinol oxidase subunit 2
VEASISTVNPATTAAFTPAAVDYTPPAQPAYATSPQHTYVPTQYGVEPLGVGSYIVMFIVMAIPLLNIIMLFVWSFGRSVNQNKKNFARAILILCVVGIVIWIVMMIALAGMMSSLMRGMPY